MNVDTAAQRSSDLFRISVPRSTIDGAQTLPPVTSIFGPADWLGNTPCR